MREGRHAAVNLSAPLPSATFAILARIHADTLDISPYCCIYMVMQDTPQIPCLCAILRRASRAVTRAYEARLEPLGVTVAQHTILRTLMHAGPLAQHALADILVMDSTTLTRTLSPLRAHGWIKQEATDDRRLRRWALTRAGERVVERCADAWQQSQLDFKARLGEAEWDTLRRSLHRLGNLAAA